MNAFLSFVSRLSAVLFLGAGLVAVPGQTATAQDAPPSLIQHLRSSLHSDNAEQRSNALVDVIALAGCSEACTVSLGSVEEKKLTINNETGTGAVVELNALVPDLLEVYRTGPTDGHRLLALTALINIGNETALERLIDEGASQTEEMNRATQKTLAAFYLEKYPELAERTMKTKRLSVDDVRRAKALRLREAKN